MIYNIESGVRLGSGIFEETGLVQFKKKSRFDDDFTDLPITQTRIRELRETRFFRGKGNRIVTDIDKDMPQISMFIKEINLQPYQRIVDLNCMQGHLGIALAQLYPDKQFLLLDNNLLNVKTASENVEKNVLPNAEVKGAIGIEGLKKDVEIDAMIFETSSYMSYPFVEQQVANAKKALSINAPLFMVSHKKSGAEKHMRYLENYFGESNVDIMERGKGGIRIIRAVKRDEDLARTPPSSQLVEFQINDCMYSLESDVGLFSKEQLDLGTRLLLETTSSKSFQKMLDVGCGWGPIGIVSALTNTEGQVVMMDVDLRATAQAQANVIRLGLQNRVTVSPTVDVKSLGGNFDLVLSNPPFHQGYGTLVELFKGVRDVMKKGGELYLVIEKSYVSKFKDVLQATLGNSSEVTKNEKYMILRSRK